MKQNKSFNETRSTEKMINDLQSILQKQTNGKSISTDFAKEEKGFLNGILYFTFLGERKNYNSEKIENIEIKKNYSSEKLKTFFNFDGKENKFNMNQRNTINSIEQMKYKKRIKIRITKLLEDL